MGKTFSDYGDLIGSVMICCLQYSHMNNDAETCTFRERTTPNCGISMAMSNRFKIFAGIPSFSWLKPKKEHQIIIDMIKKNFWFKTNLKIFFTNGEKNRTHPRTSTILFGNCVLCNSPPNAVCSAPTIAYPFDFMAIK